MLFSSKQIPGLFTQEYMQQELVAMLEVSMADSINSQSLMVTRITKLLHQLNPQTFPVTTPLPRRQLSIAGPSDSEVSSNE